jgi:hypothetical protein
MVNSRCRVNDKLLQRSSETLKRFQFTLVQAKRVANVLIKTFELGESWQAVGLNRIVR